MSDSQAELGDAIARAYRETWSEITRVMTLAEGESWEEELPDDLEMKMTPAAGGILIPLFRFTDVMYAREPSTGLVVETRADGRVRQYDPSSGEFMQSTQPLGDPRLN